MEKKKAVVYARYSSAKQHEQTIETQLDTSYAFAKREGYTVVGEYVDRKCSGTKDKRPSFRQLILDSEKGGFQYVIFYQLDRWARNRRDSINYEWELMSRGIKILSATEPINDDGEGAFWLKGIYELKNEAFSIKLKERVVDSQMTSLSNGTFIGGVKTIGYKVENKRLVVDEESAAVVREIFERASKGEFATSIYNDIKRRGLLPEMNSMQVISRMLHNVKYTGVTYYRGQCFENVYPKIIEEELFKAVQKRLRRPPGTNKAHVKYFLSGKIYCGNCQSKMRADCGTSRKTKTYYYYKCAGKVNHTCELKAVGKNYIEDLVADGIRELLSEKNIKQIAEISVSRRLACLKKDPQVDILNASLKDCQKKIDNIVVAVENGMYSATMNERLAILENERADLKEQLAAIKTYYQTSVSVEEISAELRRFAVGKSSDEEFYSALFTIFVQGVVVYPEKILIIFNVFEDNVVKFNIKNIRTILNDGSDINHLVHHKEFESLTFRSVAECSIQLS